VSNPVELVINVTADVSDVTSGFDAAGAAARDMGDDISAAATNADDSARRMDGLADSTDNVASKTGIMTGALGALAGGLSAVGLEKYGGALEGAAVATDVASGASDLLTLALESNVVKTVAATAAELAHKAVTVVSTAATIAMTAAQRALNLAMSANPILLVVTALTLIVGGLILAYNKSETFRNIVNNLGDKARDVFDKIKGWVQDVWEKFQDLVDDVRGIGGTISSLLSSAFKPIDTAIGWVKSLIDWISKIDFPDIPDINPFGRTVATGLPTATAGTVSAPVTINLTVNGAIDADGTAQTIITLLDQYLRRTGAGPLVLT
jgi:hypothetical protein